MFFLFFFLYFGVFLDFFFGTHRCPPFLVITTVFCIFLHLVPETQDKTVFVKINRMKCLRAQTKNELHQSLGYYIYSIKWITKTNDVPLQISRNKLSLRLPTNRYLTKTYKKKLSFIYQETVVFFCILTIFKTFQNLPNFKKQTFKCVGFISLLGTCMSYNLIL